MERETKEEKLQKGKDYIGVGCGALIVNGKNQVLLMLRAGDVRNQNGTWSQPGGGVDFGEKIQDAILREIKEELDIDIELIKFLTVTDHIMPEEDQHWVSPSYLARIKSGEPKILEPHKCAEIKWFNIDKVPSNLSETTKESIAVYKNLRRV